jgi:hypothetical protein
MATVRLTVHIPPDIREWLAKRADYFGASLSSEVTRVVRARMEQEAIAERQAAAQPRAMADAAAAE